MIETIKNSNLSLGWNLNLRLLLFNI
jgi:hypothetical protein